MMSSSSSTYLLIIIYVFASMNFSVSFAQQQQHIANHDELMSNNNTGFVPTTTSYKQLMVLSLSLSSPVSSGNRRDVPGDLRRRQLQKSSEDLVTHNARMRLYDNLLVNGYYTTRLGIGTPPQEYALIVDTGSTVTYVPCSNCEECGKHQDPRFQPELSSTYQPVKCNANCNCDVGEDQCTYERRYAEMSSSSGVLGEDVISFGNESDLLPQRAIFGCENVETGDIYRQHADGIMGLGRGPLSIADQLVDKGVISDSFSLCYGGMGVNGGAMVLGRITPPPDMVFSRSDPYRSPYYNIDLKGIDVAGKALVLTPKVFEGKHGVVLDSGTTYAYLPEEAFIAFKAALPTGLFGKDSSKLGLLGNNSIKCLFVKDSSKIIDEVNPLKLIRGPDPNYNDICFGGAGRDVLLLSKFFPEVKMVFGNGQKISLSPENYLFRHTKVHGAYCLGIFQNGKDPTTLLGGIVVRNTLVTYDRENEKIGFWKTNCSELWKSLQIPEAPAPAPGPEASAPAPRPVASSDEQTTATKTPPALSPSRSPHTLSLGKSQISTITFKMLFAVNYSSLKHNFSEVADFIAHGLDINASQVHLLNFTSVGNGSLIKWAVYPAKNANYISNTTAMDIVLRVTEHNLRLPENFGSYQLLDWSIQSQKQTWWRAHSLIVIVVAIVLLVLSIFTIGTWLIRRHKSEAIGGSYKPVGAAVPEQELQPFDLRQSEVSSKLNDL